MRPSVVLYASMKDILQDITLDVVEIERTWRWSWGSHLCMQLEPAYHPFYTFWPLPKKSGRARSVSDDR